jgi:hypothetical protein
MIFDFSFVNMDNKGFETDNIPAELNKSWHIPRPTLARSSKSSQGSTTSNNSTQVSDSRSETRAATHALLAFRAPGPVRYF